MVSIFPEYLLYPEWSNEPILTSVIIPAKSQAYNTSLIFSANNMQKMIVKSDKDGAFLGCLLDSLLGWMLFHPAAKL